MFYNAYRPRYVVLVFYLLVLVQDECLRLQRWVFHMHSMSSQVREAAASTLVTIYLLERDYKQTS